VAWKEQKDVLLCQPKLSRYGYIEIPKALPKDQTQENSSFIQQSAASRKQNHHHRQRSY
jgi:hypothetical protein